MQRWWQTLPEFHQRIHVLNQMTGLISRSLSLLKSRVYLVLPVLLPEPTSQQVVLLRMVIRLFIGLPIDEHSYCGSTETLIPLPKRLKDRREETWFILALLVSTWKPENYPPWNSAPENGPFQRESQSANHQFSGAMLVSGRVKLGKPKKKWNPMVKMDLLGRPTATSSQDYPHKNAWLVYGMPQN